MPDRDDECDRDPPLFRKLYPKAKRILIEVPVLAWGGATKSLRERLKAWAERNRADD